ncbi:Orotidine 5'-phosphate decarboxylase [hydrothermal vent metagenome]|uniref:Orotidine 5'-phosphate decarboxylase n=1 Tax=hydrothermal vent metagenome TaxID=652676 RepID=A0A3B1CC02_9ZZZZ
MPARERLILALDVNDPVHALDIVDRFSEWVTTFKVGLELFTSGGPDIVRQIHDRGKKVFLDLKFHDIPNTVVQASVEVTRLGVFMFNLHASGGFEMMRRTGEAVVETCLKEDLPRPKIIAVTVLTSISRDEFKKDMGYQHGIRTHVKHLSAMAHRAGLDGVVASGHEVSAIKNSIGKGFLIITPAIRPSWSLPDDQKRTMTPKEALRNGADYLVVGRAVLSRKDPQKAIELILLEILSS